MALHEQPGATDEWYTPKYVFDAMGCRFSVDVASPGRRKTPWVPAKRLIKSHGLEERWIGFVWMNPPFGSRNGILPWLDKFIEHGDGVALAPDRTSAPWWQRTAKEMDLIMFVSPKIKFIGENGRRGESPAQGTCLMAIGSRGARALRRAAKNKPGILMVPS